MKIKSSLKNPWVVGVGLLLIASIVDTISGLQVLSWIWKQIKFFFTFSFPIKLWFFVLIVLLLLIWIRRSYFVIKELKLRLPKEPEPKQKFLTLVEKYTEAIYKNVLYKWNWVESGNQKFPYTPHQIEPFCPKCNVKLIDSSAYSYCLECHKKYIVMTDDVVIINIRRDVENRYIIVKPERKGCDGSYYRN